MRDATGPEAGIGKPTPRWRTALGWAAAVGILSVLFWRIPIGETVDALKHANLALFLPAVAFAVIFWFLVESTAYSFLFTRFNTELSRREARSIRGLTYLITPIHWNAGTGAIILHLNRTKGVPALQATSTLLYYVIGDGLALAIFCLVGSYMMPESEIVRGITKVIVALGLFSVALLAVLRIDEPRFAWVKRVGSWSIFWAHRQATMEDLIKVVAFRAVYFAGFVVVYWLGARAFHADVPLPFMAASVPAVLAASSMPTPGGLGTQQAAMVYFYAPFGTEAAMLAFALALPISIAALRAALGLLYVGDLRRLRRPARGGD